MRSSMVAQIPMRCLSTAPIKDIGRWRSQGGGGDNGGGVPELTSMPNRGCLEPAYSPRPQSGGEFIHLHRVMQMHTVMRQLSGQFSVRCFRGSDKTSIPCNIRGFPAGRNRHSSLIISSRKLKPNGGSNPTCSDISNWFSLFNSPGNALNLSDYDMLHFEVWTLG